ncbi:ribosomal-protein-alanine N-acetyltransferase [Breznakia sp. PF5-3]|uniref:ribosomal protein S18-alanine N-acetyltransferase n=1 Tax=unclassified Breznakia TaxID=2623764 RepID=UPI00240657CF|nr:MULTISPECIES: ribosomal protein S18-alanine N-acetyltransferase [unclassified Breznakia]MDF9824476.1 ribosomal-protein-alanine N-acetyltransferase [Breznakia sp. PM6-1]MDF9835241.1 ribosomal-protein-alanine N-acetyltransferase [Breznakia sp. PF5-3]MDF9837431.1 ribosomal-protein-alanine N-acetyltransferase [Breznakia sp. PFB2-8]MDF9859367.1 ribosomal-protein-alanine N-acetyltransferase [Breznakia sp. PH5-24]
MIRKATMEDLDIILEIEKENFPFPYTRKQYEYEIEANPCAYLYVLEECDEVIGYIDYWITFDSCQLCKIAVTKECQRSGYGKEMLEFMFKDALSKACETAFLEVRVSNKKAISFYETFDFLEVNRRKDYYRDPKEDGIILGKVLVGDVD